MNTVDNFDRVGGRQEIRAVEAPDVDDLFANDELFADGKQPVGGVQADEQWTDEATTKPRVHPAGEVDSNPTEAHDVKLKRSPNLPNSDEVDKHDATRYPYRNWCKICVEAKAREDPHPRGHGGQDEETGLPTVSMDYELLEEKITVLVVKDNSSGSTLCYDCTVKGPSDTWVIKQLVNDLENWGRKDICLKTDNEPSMKAMQRAVDELRVHKTVPRNPPAYNPQANGAAEKAVQDVTGHMRVLVLALEARLKTKLDLSLPIVKWIIRHAAFLHSRYCVGHDGLTPIRRLTGRTWKGLIVEFGEKVLGKLAMKKPSTDKKVKRGKKKLASRSVEGIYVGIYPRTGEHLIVKKSGEVIRVRTVNRVVIEDRWVLEDILAVRATPRRPNPRTIREGEDIDVQLNVGNTAEGANAGAANRPDDDRVGGEGLGRPDHHDAHAGPRELKIDTRLLEKFGFTDECDGCIYKQWEAEGNRLPPLQRLRRLRSAHSRRAHSDVCRQRIYECMKDDDAELERLNANEKRLGRALTQEEKIRRSTAEDAPAPPAADEPAEADAPDAAAAAARPPKKRRVNIKGAHKDREVVPGAVAPEPVHGGASVTQPGGDPHPLKTFPRTSTWRLPKAWTRTRSKGASSGRTLMRTAMKGRRLHLRQHPATNTMSSLALARRPSGRSWPGCSHSWLP